jgi:molybdopterin converting factor small subunit
MDVRVDYIAQVKHAAGVATELVSLAGAAPLGDLLHRLAQRHGPEFRSLVFGENGCVNPSILVTVNDEQVVPDSGVELKVGDNVAILSPMSGG